ncbi:glycolate oxidase subunit GlcD [Acidithiobacillus thiooxidans]|uniref:Glycolate oxidase subunit GlcD n=1 Tax=Acidithiobacillus thiooxidans TaxID=930 RepID=A0A1C2IUP0_ACITH|nr:FAD-linked oxidase C-terminal domain-containing protein [Acidithiobacillus thiooxidans]OCX67402.1 glycolate oxidase subunit GlcD [Acidithiobacillus thiooxidans]OCX67544.1 glycolate oxidase subunit GlcD [Acidithiobacillus thiooxidans]OCX79713.1 glycolate oxidase subunit GlcD [Acidithiobacillus thiooxidans]OCX87107.1 glycolate oxidase subunit GlcD [Acidithiobacillus thiooxidans]OFC41010.1 glycolate oxidase subunit GlcD [Acidithiobacillus thiooxidans]
MAGSPDSEHAAFLSALRALLPDDGLLTQREDLHPYECDGLSVLRELPLAVVLPRHRAEVQAVLKICQQYAVAVVPRGAGTGLSGGARPSAGAIVLSLARLKQIRALDTSNRTARVQPGVRNLAISEAARPMGLYYAPDPSSQIACTIGGNVAENSGGVHCLKYGLTVHNVLALEVLDASGERLEIGSQAPDSPGYDLLALMMGSEGLLGIVTECTLRLLPVPENTLVLLAAFASVVAAADAVSAIIAAGIIPAGLEMMDQLAIEAAEDFVHAGYPRDAAAILLCELDGTEAELQERLRAVEKLLQRQGATSIRIAADAETRLLLWKGRKAAFPAVGRLAPDYYCMDGTIPRRRLAEVLEQIAIWSAEYGLRVANVFHAGDGNLHPLILYDANVEEQLHAAEALGQRILELCVAVGGSITGEHGVGVEKLDSMCAQFTPAELAQLHRIKAAFDPEGRLNPGKAVPSLHRCAELGAVHVHHGRLPFPELERF